MTNVEKGNESSANDPIASIEPENDPAVSVQSAAPGGVASPTVLPLFAGSRGATSEVKAQVKQASDTPPPFDESQSNYISPGNGDATTSDSLPSLGATSPERDPFISDAIFNSGYESTTGSGSFSGRAGFVADKANAPLLPLNLFKSQASTAAVVHLVKNPSKNEGGFDSSPYLAELEQIFDKEAYLPTEKVKDVVGAFKYNEALQSMRAGHRSLIIDKQKNEIAALKKDLISEQHTRKMLQIQNDRLRGGFQDSGQTDLVVQDSALVPINNNGRIYHTTIARLKANSAEIELLMAGLHIKSGMLTSAIKAAEKAQKHFKALEGYEKGEARALFWQGISWFHSLNYKQARRTFLESTELELGGVEDQSEEGMCVNLWLQKCDKKQGKQVDVARNF